MAFTGPPLSLICPTFYRDLTCGGKKDIVTLNASLHDKKIKVLLNVEL